MARFGATRAASWSSGSTSRPSWCCSRRTSTSACCRILTLPLIALAAIFTLAGWNPFIRTNDEFLWALGAAAVVPLALFILAIPFGQGAIGQGDLKLLVSDGPPGRRPEPVLRPRRGRARGRGHRAVLVFIRRLTLKSFVPYGPFLILGALWVILGLPQP